LQVARDTGWSFATVWRRAESAGIELTAGREAEGYRRLSPDRRAKRRGSAALKPEGDAGRGGARRRRQPPTVSRIERGDQRGAGRLFTPRA
jgi:hypothetical protein